MLPANKSKHVHYVHPEAINGLVTQSTKVKKRSLNMESNKEVPLELRLRNLAVDAKNTVSIVGSSESLVHLLLQVFLFFHIAFCFSSGFSIIAWRP